MKHVLSLLLLLGLLLPGAALPSAQAQVPAPDLKSVISLGPWSGAIAMASPQAIIVNFQQAASGMPTATLDVPSQRLTNFQFSRVEIYPDSVVLISEFLESRYVGRFSTDRQQLSGIWKQNGEQWNLTLRRGLPNAAPTKRPQDPTPPFPYQEQEVSFLNPTTRQKLAGTLTLPAGKGPFPAIVLVTGSGPQDRDQSLAGHRPFRVLADYLTRRGIAVLRYDDRGVGKSEGTYATATTLDFLTDAQAALAFLRTQPGVQPKHVGMLGHSEGGTIALLAGAQPLPPAFIVSLAGSGVTGTELLLRQQSDILRTAGADTARLRQMRQAQQAVLNILRTVPDNPPAIAQIVPLLKQGSPGAPESALTAMATQMTGAWYRSFLALDPQPALARVKVPVLALNGSKDLQVAAEPNLAAIEKGLKAARNRDVTVQQLDGLNHLFQSAKTGLPSEYGQLDETFSPAALQIIGNWLAVRAKK